MLKCLLLRNPSMMILFVLVLLSCTPAATPAATEAPPPTLAAEPVDPQIPTSTPVPEVITGVVEVDLLNIREGPGTSYPVVGSLNKGEKFYILGEVVNSTNNKWLLISPSSDSFGWVIGDQSYVTIQKEIVDLSTYLVWQKNVTEAKSTLAAVTASP